MDRFWGVMGVLFIVGLAAVVNGAESNDINFTDLETECRYGNMEDYTISLQQDNSLAFKGNFPVNSTGADLSYAYSMDNNRIIVDIIAENENEVPDNYDNSCLASVFYSAQTEPLKQEDYIVEIRHDGREVEKQVIRVK